MIPNPGTAQFALSAGIYKELSTSQLLSTLTKGVFDGDAPPAIAYPYIVIGETTEGNNDLLNRFGMVLTVAIHVWSRYRGTSEAKIITNEILKRLNRHQLPCEDWVVTLATYEGANTLTEGDEVRHAIIRMRYKMSPKE